MNQDERIVIDTDNIIVPRVEFYGDLKIPYLEEEASTPMVVKPRLRGFEPVSEAHRKNPNLEIKMPRRADKRSAGYDFYSPYSFTVGPGQTIFIPTDIKAYMLDDEQLVLHVRSSIGTERKLRLANVTGIVDSSYYNNPKNDGNIGFFLYNYGDLLPQYVEAGERIVQGVFEKYLITDDDDPIHDARIGGTGSSNR